MSNSRHNTSENSYSSEKKDHKDSNHSHDSFDDSIEKSLHTIAETTTVTHMSGVHLKGPLNYIGPIAEVLSEIIHDPSGNLNEKIACGTSVALTKEAINTAVAARVGLYAGLAASVPATPMGGIAVGATTGITAYKITEAITEPLGKIVEESCHDAFQQLRNLAEIKTIPTKNIPIDNDYLFSIIDSKYRDMFVIIHYVNAILNGAALCGVFQGLMDVVNMIAHPLDNLVYPISDLIFDIAVINAGSQPELSNLNVNNIDNGDIRILQEQIKMNPKLYTDAIQRMNERIALLGQMGSTFMKATPDKQIEMLSRFSTGILVPGFMIKGIKAANNYRKLGHCNPPQFHLNEGISADLLEPVRPITKLTLADIRNQTGSQKYMYVITQKGELIITPRDYAYSLDGLSKMGSQKRGYRHYELCNMEAVLAAGDIEVENGMVTMIDNASGGYQPNGGHIEELVTKRFEREGFHEARGKFVDMVTDLIKDMDLISQQTGLDFSVKMTQQELKGSISYLTGAANELQQLFSNLATDYYHKAKKLFDEQEYLECLKVLSIAEKLNLELFKINQPLVSYFDIYTLHVDACKQLLETNLSPNLKKIIEETKDDAFRSLAGENAEEAARLHPENYSAHRHLGDKAVEEGLLYLALKHYSNAILANPKDTVHYLLRATVYKQLKDYGNYLKDRYKVGEIEYAGCLEPDGEYVWELEDLYRSCLEKDGIVCPTSEDQIEVAEINNLYANELKGKGELKQALEHCDRAIGLKPDNIKFIKNRLNILFQLKEYDRCFEDLDLLIELEPEKEQQFTKLIAQVLRERADNLIEQNEFQSASADLYESLKIDPDSVEALSSAADNLIIGLLLFKPDKKSDLNKDDIKKLKANAYKLRGICQNNIGLEVNALPILNEHFKKADKDYDDAILLNPDDAYLYFLRGQANYNRTLYSTARRQIEKVLDMEPNNREAKEFLKEIKDKELDVEIKEQIKREEKVTKYLKKANDFYDEGEYSDALEYFKKAHEISPYRSDIKSDIKLVKRIIREEEIREEENEIAECLEEANDLYKAGKYAKSLEYFKKAHELDPDRSDIESDIELVKSVIAENARIAAYNAQINRYANLVTWKDYKHAIKNAPKGDRAMLYQRYQSTPQARDNAAALASIRNTSGMCMQHFQSQQRQNQNYLQQQFERQRQTQRVQIQQSLNQSHKTNQTISKELGKLSQAFNTSGTKFLHNVKVQEETRNASIGQPPAFTRTTQSTSTTFFGNKDTNSSSNRSFNSSGHTSSHLISTKVKSESSRQSLNMSTNGMSQRDVKAEIAREKLQNSHSRSDTAQSNTTSGTFIGHARCVNYYGDKNASLCWGKDSKPFKAYKK